MKGSDFSTLPEKIQRKITVEENGCWTWYKANGWGYGTIHHEGRSQAAHRVIYTALSGEIPEGLHLDHLCRNPLCVNPEHLEPVTQQENNRRRDARRGEGRFRNPQALSESDLLLLEAVRSGQTLKEFASSRAYSERWAKWKSKAIRDKLGVASIREAVEMSEYAGLEGRIGGLERKLDDAISALTAAVTPKEQDAAKATIRDLKDELRLRGLTEKDLDEAAERKQAAKIDERVAAALKLRDEEAAAAAAANGDGEELEPTFGEKIRDGLGGIRNVKPS